MTSLQRLATSPLDKVWGSPLTEPWYRNTDQRQIGEIWFKASEAVPLLVKFLFTSDKLSVQVHPDDAFAKEHENSLGKTEMWHVLRAEPDARIAIGLRETITPERLRSASLSGEIEALLSWIPARPGETFFIPAGTIHAIGGGLVLCEVQELSDVTYRLNDYGRPRELHLEKGVEVSHLGPWNALVQPKTLLDGRELLCECPWFRTERLAIRGRATCPAAQRGTLYIALSGKGLIDGNAFETGEAWEAAAGSNPFEIESGEAVFLITSEPVTRPAS